MSSSPLADMENSSQFEFYGSHQRLFFSDFRLDYTDQQEVCPGLQCMQYGCATRRSLDVWVNTFPWRESPRSTIKFGRYLWSAMVCYRNDIIR